VEALDIVEHISPGLGAGLVDTAVDAFAFQQPTST
jgi:hypothetical protein